MRDLSVASRGAVPSVAGRPRYAVSTLAWLGVGLLAIGCAGSQKVKESPLSTELELAYDDGNPSERPLLPPPAFEWLVKFEPNLPAYQPLRLRLLLAQPGPLRLSLYAADAAGRPGSLLRTIERSYGPELSSGGQDGKWLLEALRDLPVQTAPLFVGIAVPSPGSDAARLWATARPSTQVFQRDPEPATALQSSRLQLTPILRLALVPAEVPVAQETAAPKAAPTAAPATAPAAVPATGAAATPTKAPAAPGAAAPAAAPLP